MMNVKEIENCISFLKKLLTLLFIYLFIYLFMNNNCDNHFAKTAFENQQFKKLTTDYFKNRQVSSFWNL